jgi:hypothetical protein
MVSLYPTQWPQDILGACRAQLRHCHAPARHIADALAGMILLDHKTPAQCLEELLNARLGMCSWWFLVVRPGQHWWISEATKGFGIFSGTYASDLALTSTARALG